MKNTFFYALLVIATYFVVGGILAITIGGENSKTAMLVLNIPIVLLYTFLYFKTPEANAANFALITFAIAIFTDLAIAAFLRQGMQFLFSPVLWVLNIERIAIPFLYNWFKARSSKPLQPEPLPPVVQ